MMELVNFIFHIMKISNFRHELAFKHLKSLSILDVTVLFWKLENI